MKDRPLLFSLIVGSLTGTGLWLLAFAGDKGWITLSHLAYPASEHALLMLLSFLFPAFALLLLNVAEPGADNTAAWRYLPAAGGTIAFSVMVVALALPVKMLLPLAAALALLYLGYAVYLALRHGQDLGCERHFLALAMVHTLLGLFFFSWDFYNGRGEAGRLSHAYLYYGVAQFLFVGLLPKSLGFEKRKARNSSKAILQREISIFETCFIFLFFQLAVLSENLPGNAELISSVILFLLFSYILLRLYGIYKIETLDRAYKWAVYLFGTMFLLGFFASAVMPEKKVHLIHFHFVGGLALFVFASLTKQTDKVPGIEKGRKRLLLTIWGMIAFAAVTRAVAIFLPKIYMSHLAYASLLFALALGLWLYAQRKRL